MIPSGAVQRCEFPKARYVSAKPTDGIDVKHWVNAVRIPETSTDIGLAKEAMTINFLELTYDEVFNHDIELAHQIRILKCFFSSNLNRTE